MNRRAGGGGGGLTAGGAMLLTTERMNANFTPNKPIGEAKLDEEVRKIGIRNDSLRPFDKLSGNWAVAGRVGGTRIRATHTTRIVAQPINLQLSTITTVERDLTSNLKQRAARKRNEAASPKTLQLRKRKAARKAAPKTALAAKAEYRRIANERAAADEARINGGDGGGDVAMRDQDFELPNDGNFINDHDHTGSETEIVRATPHHASTQTQQDHGIQAQQPILALAMPYGTSSAVYDPTQTVS
ncbi:hypothetical protein LTR97_005586 [Elasticomyces elasticus]|uniref:Uncharacterized protein n=1 Tax=Elasticomyces elasticus TaxID=574655 RepID=A0AAN7WCL1_9PEZI|nr:hypothetical protein LTR97_005586 [Elasticomyces elasticus]